MNMFKKVQIRFWLIPVLVCALLMLVVFSFIFGIASTSSAKNAEKSVAISLDANLDTALNAGFYEKCITIYQTQHGEISSSKENYFVSEDKLDELIEQIKQEKSSIIKFNGRVIMVGYKSDTYLELPVMRYALYDYSTEYATLQSLLKILIAVYFVTILAIGVIAYIFSSSAVEPLKIAFKKQQELVANASHELKTPLTIAQTNLDLVMSEPDQTVLQNHKWLDSASYQLSRMNSLVLQMLELSTLEAGNKKDLHYDQVDLTQLVQGTLLSFEAAMYEKNILLTSDIDQNVTYECNSIEMEKLVNILIDNAKKYTPADGEINCKLVQSARCVKFTVTNSGNGIKPDELDNVFERFYKSDASHAESGNSFGLGLSIAKSIANSLGGDIVCKSNGESWTAFEVTLPTKIHPTAKHK